ncbi:MAG: hypothetical protein ACLFRV_00835 [Acidimicrobiales bacterium]
MASTYWKFRAQLGDRPGGLASAARVFADLGANILDVDVHLLEPTQVADDVVVELAYWAEPGAVEQALLAAGATEVSGRRLDPHELVDGQARVLDLATRLVQAPDLDAELVAVLRALATCDLAWLGPAPGLVASPAQEHALAHHEPVITREPLARLAGDRDGKVWVAAIPWRVAGDRVACLARLAPRFSATEIARVQSMLGLVDSLPLAHPSRV